MRLKASSCPSGEKRGAHSGAAWVTSVRAAPPARGYTSSAFRVAGAQEGERAVLRKTRAGIRSRAGGEPHGTASSLAAASATGSWRRPGSTHGSLPRPSRVKTGESLKTPVPSLHRGAGLPPRAATPQISRDTPPLLRTKAICAPSGDQAGAPRNGWVPSPCTTSRRLAPSAPATASASGAPGRRRMKASRVPSGDQAGCAPHAKRLTALPPKVGITQISVVRPSAPRREKAMRSPSGENAARPFRAASCVSCTRAPPATRPRKRS